MASFGTGPSREQPRSTSSSSARVAAARLQREGQTAAARLLRERRSPNKVAPVAGSRAAAIADRTAEARRQQEQRASPPPVRRISSHSAVTDVPCAECHDLRAELEEQARAHAEALAEVETLRKSERGLKLRLRVLERDDDDDDDESLQERLETAHLQVDLKERELRLLRQGDVGAVELTRLDASYAEATAENAALRSENEDMRRRILDQAQDCLDLASERDALLQASRTRLVLNEGHLSRRAEDAEEERDRATAKLKLALKQTMQRERVRHELIGVSELDVRDLSQELIQTKLKCAQLATDYDILSAGIAAIPKRH